MITPFLVGPILSGKASICHVVGMGQRVCRKRLLVHMAPTKGTLKSFRESSLQQRRSKRTAPRVRGSNWSNMHDPRIVIDWLAATEHVKNINQAWFTARAFARIFAKHGQCDVSEVMGSTRHVHFGTLRRARIRLDAVASLWRQWWREIPDSSISIFLVVLASRVTSHSNDLTATRILKKAVPCPVSALLEVNRKFCSSGTWLLLRSFVPDSHSFGASS